jgi:hypothetical protein
MVSKQLNLSLKTSYGALQSADSGEWVPAVMVITAGISTLVMQVRVLEKQLWLKIWGPSFKHSKTKWQLCRRLKVIIII